MEQVTLRISDNVRAAMDYAFDEAQTRLSQLGESFDPFSVIVVDEGLEFNDHPGVSAEEVRDSVRILLAQNMPEGYALGYDGYVETDEGQLDAVIVEVADRGATHAETLALLYTLQDGVYTFETDYAYVGPAHQLYPAGTKPIVSGLATLETDQASDADFDDDYDMDEPTEVTLEAPQATEE